MAFFSSSLIQNKHYQQRNLQSNSIHELIHDEFTFTENICIENGYSESFVTSQIRKAFVRYFERLNETKTCKSMKKIKKCYG